MAWFEVDKDGLARRLERRPKGWILTELLQNAWDAPRVSTAFMDRFACGMAHYMLER